MIENLTSQRGEGGGVGMRKAIVLQHIFQSWSPIGGKQPICHSVRLDVGRFFFELRPEGRGVS